MFKVIQNFFELKLIKIIYVAGKLDYYFFFVLFSYLINIFALNSISSVAGWALSTLPGAIGEAGALDSSKTGVG